MPPDEPAESFSAITTEIRTWNSVYPARLSPSMGGAAAGAAAPPLSSAALSAFMAS
eukprot:COSAG01_NODE_119_length_25410_cov_1333.312275_20_plen_56_part_00